MHKLIIVPYSLFLDLAPFGESPDCIAIDFCYLLAETRLKNSHELQWQALSPRTAIGQL